MLLTLATMILFSPGRYHIVYVKTCDGAFASIYTDSTMRQFLPNPFIAERDGTAQFYTTSKCVRIS